MRRKHFLITLVAIFVMAFTACGKKEEKEPAQPAPALAQLTQAEEQKVLVECASLVIQAVNEKGRKLTPRELKPYKSDCKKMVALARLHKGLDKSGAKIDKTLKELKVFAKDVDKMNQLAAKRLGIPYNPPPLPMSGTKGPPSEF